MTRRVDNLRTLIKQAKSAKDKAKEIAALAGKPTSTGIAAGTGLGALLAAAGALSRTGEDPDNVSVLSNPLLLGTLGAAGGYIAGNAIDKIPTKRDRKELSGTSLAGLLTGIGLTGRHLAKTDAKKGINSLKNRFEAVARRVPTTIDQAGNKVFHLGQRQLRDGTWVAIQPRGAARAAFEAERNEFMEAQKAYQKALLRSGNAEEAIKNVGYQKPEKLGRRFIEFLKHSPSSPKNVLKALNPMKGKKLLSQLGGFFKLKGSGLGKYLPRNASARIAALALLAGGGKAVYDYTSD